MCSIFSYRQILIDDVSKYMKHITQDIAYHSIRCIAGSPWCSITIRPITAILKVLIETVSLKFHVSVTLLSTRQIP